MSIIGTIAGMLDPNRCTSCGKKIKEYDLDMEIWTAIVPKLGTMQICYPCLRIYCMKNILPYKNRLKGAKKILSVILGVYKRHDKELNELANDYMLKICPTTKSDKEISEEFVIFMAGKVKPEDKI